MLAVYPASLTSRTKFFAVFVPTVAMKLVRIVTITLALVHAQRHPVVALTYHLSSGGWQRTWAILDRCVTALDNV
jgi:hypothetical protein